MTRSRPETLAPSPLPLSPAAGARGRICGRLLLLAVGVYALTGFYIVQGNEKAVVRRCGRVVTPLMPSGLHWDWPYPFTKIDRINFAAVETMTVGGAASQSTDSLLSTKAAPAWLTGDQNLLQVRAQVIYRPAEEQVADYLFAQSRAADRLAQLTEALLMELLAHSGVDFAHVRGLSELNEKLTQRLRRAVAEQRLGLDIEQAVLEQVEPPLRVKAEFLDVSNARAEQARSIQDARTWAEQKLSQANSERQRNLDNAEADRQSRTAAAHGSADRFRKLVAQMRTEAERQGNDYAQVRQLTVQRLSWQTLTEVWPKIRKKTIVDSTGPVDLGVFPKSP
jgi:membrane protease subunit HflK